MPYHNGNIIASPNCPQNVGDIPITDLRQADFRIGIDTTLNRPEPIVEAIAAFTVGDPEDEAPYSRVETDFIIEPVDSPLGQQLQRLAGIENDAEGKTVSAEDNPQAEGIRLALLSRAVICQCIGRTCWAMGDTSFREVLTNTLLPNQEA